MVRSVEGLRAASSITANSVIFSFTAADDATSAGCDSYSDLCAAHTELKASMLPVCKQPLREKTVTRTSGGLLYLKHGQEITQPCVRRTS